jgi:membrane-associated phospholipid phosphatase/protein-S-isoprenylcysteine O-methyltransferase Ste14
LENLSRFSLPKVLYGLIFVAVLPAALVAWARAANGAISIAAPQSMVWGSVPAALGVAITLLGMVSLWVYGGGLPMNAFPPPRFVQSGIYALIPHPIYSGFVLACGGVSIVFGSASGLWLVTPCVALACAALVFGYELPDLRQRFGQGAASPWPTADDTAAPSLVCRFRVYFLVLLPWLVAFGAIMLLGKPVDAVATYLPFEMHLPVIDWTELPYASTYLVVLLAPLLVKTGQELRRLAVRGLTAMLLLFPLYLLLPFFVPPRPFTPATAMGSLLLLERSSYSGAGAFPSFHIVWALIAASVLGEGGRWRRILWYAWAALVAVSCVTTGMHSVLDVLAGAIAFALVVNMGRIWAAILWCTERIANSWQEWRIGPVRIINHGAYAGAASFVGMLMIDTLLGAGYELVTASIFLCAIVGAAFWAQWVEGSPALLRPLGFYGGMAGAIIGAIPALWLGVNMWVALAAICIAGPWIQGVGRLRCLVQGCCHGRATEAAEGIRYVHPRSRVCRLAHLTGVPVHATPVYSILWNAWIGLALLRLFQLHSPATLIAGIYLFLSGVGRFVEEAYRGEPQTKILFGLRLYQWIAVLTVVAGAVVTSVQATPMAQEIEFRLSSFVIAAGCGAFAWFVTGVDFPESSRRFARLT